MQNEVAGRGIDAADRFVEEIELRAPRHDEDQLHLLARALGEGFELSVDRNAEDREHLPRAPLVEVGVEVAEQAAAVAHPHAGLEVHPLGEVGDHRLGRGAGRLAVDEDRARRGLE